MKDKKFSQEMRESREFLSLSQKEFAVLIGLQERMVVDYESGRFDASKGDVRRRRLIERMREAVRKKKTAEENISSLTFPQDGDLGKRISNLESQVNDLQATVLKIVNKIGL